MHLTALTSIAAAVTGTVAVVATGAILAFTPSDAESQVWFDFPVAAGTIYSGPVVVTAHTDEPKATAIVVTLSQGGAVVTALTDSSLELTGTGAGAAVLYSASSPWDAPVGVYDVTASVYRGSAVVQEETSTLTVIAFAPSGVGVPQPSPSTEPTSLPSPSASASASATPSPSPTASASGPSPKPTKPPKATPTPEPSGTPPQVTPEPSVTPEPPPEPLAGKVTRSNESNYGWTNTFTVTGFRPQGAQVFVEINLHNTIVAPYYAGWKAYPCGTPSLYSGSGSTATYQCSVTVTIEPPGNWKSGEFWYSMPSSVFRSKVVTGGKTYYGTGGNWAPQAKGV